MSTTPLIKFNNISKRYASGQDSLRNINLTISQGEMVFLTGHSGAGKSTLLKLIHMMERPSQGQLFVFDQNIAQISLKHIPYLRRQMGTVFQDPHLLSSRTVYENVALPLIILGTPHQEIKRRVQASLDKVGLLHKERCYPLALSSGEQQRVGIARAVVHKPSLLLADEPTGNLDPDLALEIMNLFEEFNHVGTTIVIATHALALIARFKNRIIRLQEGHVVAQGELADAT